MAEEILVRATRIRLGGKAGKGLRVGKEGEPFAFGSVIPFESTVSIGHGDVFAAEIKDGTAIVKRVVKTRGRD